VNWTAVILVATVPLVVLMAWTAWLIFAALVVKWHGPEGLRAIKPVATGFRPREWALLVPRQAPARGARYDADPAHREASADTTGPAHSAGLPSDVSTEAGRSDDLTPA
jgi:hypothetical protein